MAWGSLPDLSKKKGRGRVSGPSPKKSGRGKPAVPARVTVERATRNWRTKAARSAPKKVLPRKKAAPATTKSVAPRSRAIPPTPPARATLEAHAAAHQTEPPKRIQQQVRRQFAQAEKRVKRSTKLEGPLTPSQKTFSKEVARRTRLRPRTIAAQALAEESSTAAAQREAEGNQNWLNIGPGAELSPNVKQAAAETAHLINSSDYYAGIRSTRGKSAQKQVAAIAASPWGTVGSTMEGTLPLVRAHANPQAQQRVARVEQKAKALGVKLPSKVGPAPPKLVKKVIVAEHAMAEVAGTPYEMGGGHGAPHSEPTNGTLDCSGAVGYVLNKLRVMKGSATSGEMGRFLDPGPGALTVYYNAGHTFLSYINRHGKTVYWGTSVGDSGAGGLGPHPTPSKAYLAQYSVGHVPGMGKKQALQLGGSVAFPGMSFSPSGTTATIASGAGVTKSQPGSSSRPIVLTPYQKLQRFRNRRSSAQGREEALAPAPAKAASALATLERKYGKA